MMQFCREIAREFSSYNRGRYTQVPSASANGRGTGLSGPIEDSIVDVSQNAPTRRIIFIIIDATDNLSADKRGIYTQGKKMVLSLPGSKLHLAIICQVDLRTCESYTRSILIIVNINSV